MEPLLKSTQKRREVIAVVCLALLSSVFVFWQAGRVLPLFDYSYQIENAYRIAIGQVPYRDFILITAPMMHVLLALFMKIFGYTSLAPLLYMLLLSFAVVLVTYWLLVLLKMDRRMRLYFLFPIVVAAHGIIPLPSYDVTATLFVLLSLAWLTHLIVYGKTYFLRYFMAGALIVLPALAKQNVGLGYMAAIYVALFLISLASPGTVKKKLLLVMFVGSAVAGGLFLALLFFTHAFVPFLRQNRFVFINRDPISYGLAVLYDIVYWKNLLIYVPFIAAFAFIRSSRNKRLNTVVASTAVAMSLAVIPAIYFFLISGQPAYTDYYFKLRVAVRYFFSVWYLVLIMAGIVAARKLSQLKHLKKEGAVILLVTVGAGSAAAVALLAQGVGGSTFGIYPFFVILLACFYQLAISKNVSWNPVYTCALLLTAVFLLGFAASNIRQSYVQVAGMPRRFESKSLRFLGTPGPWAGEIDGMLRFVDTVIPQRQTVVALPGEDPFYFATGRRPQLKYFELFSGALPYTPERIASDISVNNIDWLVVKTHLQSAYYMDTRPIVKHLDHCYALFRQIPGYSVYRKLRPC